MASPSRPGLRRDFLGDRIQLQQVLLNLILNATEAMSSTEKGARELLISSEQYQAGALVACAISGRALIRRISIGSSMPSTPPSPVEQAWGCRYAAPS
jgi:nitrogen-specific signal transduction histidine kinase